MSEEAIDIQRVLEDNAALQKRVGEAAEEIAYYRKNFKEVAGEKLKSDYTIMSLRHEVKQKREAFALLSNLQSRMGARQEISQLFANAVQAINSTVGMDRTVVLVPAEKPGTYRPTQWLGFKEEEDISFGELSLNVPEELHTGKEILLVNGKTAPTPFIEEARKVFGLPFFIAINVLVEDKSIGMILSGRVTEANIMSPPLDQADVDTFRAVAGFISASVRNMQVAVLEEMDRVKTDFFANISHEFRTPITLTLGPLRSLLDSRYGALPDPARAQVNIMLRNQERLLNLVNQILDLAKLDAGGMELKASRCPDLNKFLNARVELFRTAAEQRGLQLLTRFDEAVSQTEVFIDPEMFDKVIFNLLSNSLKFTKQGSLEVSSKLEGDEVEIAIRDTGVGIREDQLPYIFDRFRQADGSSTREHAGTGIGLALVKEIVALHQGKVSASSKYGQGTTFHIRVKVGKAHLDPKQIVENPGQVAEVSTVNKMSVQVAANDQSQASADEHNAKAQANRDPSRPTVLYVDDNPDLRNYVRDILVKEYNVFLGVNGVDGLEQLERYRPDLVLSDLMMPKMNGTQFCQAVRRNPTWAGLPFVILTAKAGTESKMEGLEEGADDYLHKPFAEDELLVRVRNLIKLRKQTLQVQSDLRAARQIQRAILPANHERFGRAELAALYLPSEMLSGDMFGWGVREPWLYFYTGDVTSHGTAAAQVTYLVQSIFRNLVGRWSDDLPKFAEEMARQYAEYRLDYDTGIALARLNLETLVLECVRGNAPAPLLCKAGAVTMMKVPPGHPLQGRPPAEGLQHAECGSVTLEPGTSVYLYTDGCYEFESGGRQFGPKRLIAVMGKADGDQWAERARTSLEQANGSPVFPDDLTIVRLAVSA